MDVLRVMLKLHTRNRQTGCFLSSRLAMRNKKRGDFGVVVCLFVVLSVLIYKRLK